MPKTTRARRPHVGGSLPIVPTAGTPARRPPLARCNTSSLEVPGALRYHWHTHVLVPPPAFDPDPDADPERPHGPTLAELAQTCPDVAHSPHHHDGPDGTPVPTLVGTIAELRAADDATCDTAERSLRHYMYITQESHRPDGTVRFRGQWLRPEGEVLSVHGSHFQVLHEADAGQEIEFQYNTLGVVRSLTRPRRTSGDTASASGHRGGGGLAAKPLVCTLSGALPPPPEHAVIPVLARRGTAVRTRDFVSKHATVMLSVVPPLPAPTTQPPAAEAVPDLPADGLAENKAVFETQETLESQTAWGPHFSTPPVHDGDHGVDDHHDHGDLSGIAVLRATPETPDLDWLLEYHWNE